MATAIETRNFKMHPALLYSVMRDQAGTREKAILESVMNCVDAGATKIDIRFNRDHITVRDDGRGFRSRQEIEQFFETFGTPHVAGDATYGRFRMGRGQMFAFGRNYWTSGTFRMYVDIKGSGLDYTLKERHPEPGCTIRMWWYDKLTYSTAAELERDLKKYVRWVSIPITVNGVQVSSDPGKESWDVTKPNAYFRFRDTGPLLVYNLGVFVREYPGSQFGTSGIVVSRRLFDVNFARNDIKADCSVWKSAQKELRGQTRERTATKKTALTDDERARLVLDVLDGEVDSTAASKLKLFTDVTGRTWSANEISRHLYKNNITQISACRQGNSHGDRVMQHGVGFVLSRESLEEWGAESMGELLHTLNGLHLHLNATAVDFNALAASLNHEQVLVPRTKWTPTEVAAIDHIRHASELRRLFWQLHPDAERGWQNPDVSRGPKERTIVLGAGSADAWTDGATYIAINRRFFKQTLDVSQWARIAAVLAHEYAHADSTTDSHVHTPEFYRRYHDCYDEVAYLSGHLAQRWGEALRKRNRRLSKYLLKVADRLYKGTEQEMLNSAILDVQKELEQIKERLAAFDGDRIAKRTAAKERRRARGWEV